MFQYIRIGCISVLLMSTSAFAYISGYPTDVEVKSLPPYCKARLNKSSPEYITWANQLGKGFEHTHHHCQGLNLINRYYKESNTYYLTEALGEFGYIIAHAESTYTLIPDAYMNRGFAHAKLHQDGEALKDFMKSLELNPRSPQTYSMIANFYEERKMSKKALESLIEGLKYIPNNKTLQRRYLKLGGKEPFPEPYEQVKTNLPPEEKINEVTPTPSEEKANPTEKVEPKLDKSEPPAIDNLPTKIGVPGNPFCRFCPDPAPISAPVITTPLKKE